MGTTFNVENNILSIKSTFRNAQEINIIWMDRYIDRQVEIQKDRYAFKNATGFNSICR